jgi:lipoprotein-releasing system permease protein
MPDCVRAARESLQNPAVKGAAPYVDAQALLTSGGKVVGVALRGIDPQLEPHVSDILWPKVWRSGSSGRRPACS